MKNFYPEHFFQIFYANRLTFPTKPPRMFYSELFNMKQSSIEQLLIEQSLFKQFYNEQMGTAAKGKGGKSSVCCKKRKIGHELRTLDNMMSRNLMAAARERGVDELTAMHGWILGYLCRNEDKDIFQKDIEAEFKICRSTVTNILKLMEKKGYIRRESVPYDARLKKLVLTDTGRELHEKTKDMIDILEEQTVAGISKEDLETFYRVIDQLKSNVKNMLGETSC